MGGGLAWADQFGVGADRAPRPSCNGLVVGDRVSVLCVELLFHQVERVLVRCGHVPGVLLRFVECCYAVIQYRAVSMSRVVQLRMGSGAAVRS